MKAHLDWRQQLGVLREQLLTTYLPVLALIGVVTLVAKLTHVPLIDLLKDPAALKEQPFYVGFFSNVGVLLWWAAACVCLFTAALLQRTTALSSSQPVRRGGRPAPLTSFFLTAGLISSYLALDDLFLFHDQVFPEYLGIPEKLVLLAIGITLLAFLYTFRNVILRSDVLPLALALTFFVTKELFDQLAELLPTVYSISLLEDYAKLLGIASWLAYFTRTALQHVSTLLGPAADAGPALATTDGTPITPAAHPSVASRPAPARAVASLPAAAVPAPLTSPLARSLTQSPIQSIAQPLNQQRSSEVSRGGDSPIG